MNEDEVKQMLREAIDKDPEGTVWHVNTKHLMTFAQMVADKTRKEISSPTKIMGPNLEAVLNSAGFYKKDLIRTQEAWDEYIYEQGEVESRSKEDQRKADEAAWSDARIACAAIRDAALDAAGDDIRAIDAAWYAYRDSCAAIDDRWDAARAKRERGGVNDNNAKEEDMDTPVLKIGYQDYHKTLHGINGCNNLHQKSVEIFDREEDEETGLHVVAERDKQLLVDEDMSNNPSSRRQGLKINFSCECCEGKVHTLNIAQHKGTTFVFWSE